MQFSTPKNSILIINKQNCKSLGIKASKSQELLKRLDKTNSQELTKRLKTLMKLKKKHEKHREDSEEIKELYTERKV